MEKLNHLISVHGPLPVKAIRPHGLSGNMVSWLWSPFLIWEYSFVLHSSIVMVDLYLSTLVLDMWPSGIV